MDKLIHVKKYPWIYLLMDIFTHVKIYKWIKLSVYKNVPAYRVKSLDSNRIALLFLGENDQFSIQI